ncbi:MAG TPA: DUF4230 domain-containing protein [Bacteroidota bacterium]|nr:DUF4230 domain-containing protein [Bacteroidota bacterium]
MRSKGLLVTSVGAAILILAGAWTVYTIFVKAPAALAAATADGIEEFLHVRPKVQIDQTVVIEQTTPIMEFATESRQLLVDYSWSHTWLGSTKTIRLNGVFTAKAGFDLREPFTIAIQRNPLRVDAMLPRPKILSLEMTSYKVAVDESGWWNRISNADREAALGALQATARSQAESSGMLEEARTSVESRIREIVEKNGATVRFSPVPAL